MSLLEAYFGLLMGAQIASCLLPLCLDLHRRPRPALRAVAATVLLVAALWACLSLSLPAFSAAPPVAILSPLVFAGTLLAFVVAMMMVWEVSVWQAVFCCTAAYTAQNIMSGFEFAFRTLAGEAATSPFGVIVLRTVVPMALVLPVYELLFARNVRKWQLEFESDREVILFAPLVILAVITLDIAIKQVPMEQTSVWSAIVMRLAHEAICAFILYSEYKVLLNRKLTNERAVERGMLQEQRRQYEASRQTIDAINMKCHDIRHQIRRVSEGGDQTTQEALRDLAHEVSIYDSTVKTGNPALDVILTEKGLVCSQLGIQLSVMADGGALAFLPASETYAFFGNALDNAIEAVERVEDEARRVITLNVHAQMKMVVITVENYCARVSEFRDGLPVTTKPDHSEHGFGMRSMRQIAESHGGVLKVGCEDGVFHVDALLPVA